MEGGNATFPVRFSCSGEWKGIFVLRLKYSLISSRELLQISADEKRTGSFELKEISGV